MDKFTIEMADLKPETRAELEKWLGYQVMDYEILTELYDDDCERDHNNDSVDEEETKETEDTEEPNLTSKRTKWMNEVLDELWGYFFESGENE